MKEKIFNNMIFIFLIILLLIFSLKCFLISFQVIEEGLLIRIVNQGIGLIYSSFTHQILMAFVGFLFFIISLYLIWLKQKVTQQIPSVKVPTNFGEIKISTQSLSQMILHILKGIEGVRQINPAIQIQKNGEINTMLQLIVSPECNIPNIAHNIQEKIKEELPKISGVEVKTVKINVEKIDYEK